MSENNDTRYWLGLTTTFVEAKTAIIDIAGKTFNGPQITPIVTAFTMGAKAVAASADGWWEATKQVASDSCGVAAFTASLPVSVAALGPYGFVMSTAVGFAAEGTCRLGFDVGESYLDQGDIAIGGALAASLFPNLLPSEKLLSAYTQSGLIIESSDPIGQQNVSTGDNIGDDGKDAGFVAGNQSDRSNLADNPTQVGEPSLPLSSPSSCSYTIKSGDTLSEIAERNGTSVEKLMEANPQIADKDTIFADQKINLPEADSVPPGADLGLYGDIPVESPPTEAPEDVSQGTSQNETDVGNEGASKNLFVSNAKSTVLDGGDLSDAVQNPFAVATEAESGDNDPPEELADLVEVADESLNQGLDEKIDSLLEDIDIEDPIAGMKQPVSFDDVVGDTSKIVSDIAEDVFGGITEDFTKAWNNLADLVTIGEVKQEKIIKPTGPQTSLAGKAANAGGQAWVDSLADSQGWSDFEQFSAKVGMATIAKGIGNELDSGSFTDGNTISGNITEIGAGMGEDFLYNEIGEQLGLSPEEISQARATISVLSNLSNAKNIDIDTALTAVGLNDEIGSTAIANQIIPPESSESAVLGSVGGAVGGAIGSIYGPACGYAGSMLGTMAGNIVGNVVGDALGWGDDDPNPKSFAEIVFNEDTGEFEIDRSWGHDGMDGSTGESLAQSVLDQLNGTEDQPGLLDQMKGEDGQVANGRYIEPIKIGYNDGKYQLGSQKFGDVEDMIQKAVITTAQEVQVEDGNPYIQQAVYASDSNADLSNLYSNIKTATDFQVMENQTEAVRNIRFDAFSQEAGEESIDPDLMDQTISEAESGIDVIQEAIRAQKAAAKGLADKGEELARLEENLNESEQTYTSGEYHSFSKNFIVENISSTKKAVSELRQEISELTAQQETAVQTINTADDKQLAIAEYREAVQENEAASNELKELYKQLPDLENTLQTGWQNLINFDPANGPPSDFDENSEQLDEIRSEIALINQRIEELEDTIESNTETIATLMENGGDNFYLEVTDWDRVQSVADNLDLDQSDQHTKTSRLNILLENELDLDLDSVNISDLMVEVKPDGSMEIGFRTDSEEGVTDVDDLTHKVRIDNWESWSETSTLEFANGKSYELKPIIANLSETNADNEQQLDMQATIEEIWGEDANVDKINFAFGGDGDDTLITADDDDYIDAGEGNNTVISGEGNDFIKAGDGDNFIDSGLGDDQVVLGDGANTVKTGEGDDRVTVGDGDNQVVTGDGDDRIELGDGSNVVDSGSGDDTIKAGDGDNIILTGSGDDTITAGNGNNQIVAGEGDDEIILGDGDNIVDAGAGDDTIKAGDGDQQIFAGEGNNTVETGDGDSTIVAGDSSDTIITGDGDQTIQAGGGDNRIDVGAGDSIIASGDGSDTITTGDGDQQIFAGEGDNTVQAGDGDSHISTGAGDNRIETGDGDQAIQTGSGDDEITTGEGDQTIVAGDGNNTVQIGYGDSTIIAGDGDDTITMEGGDHGIEAGDGNNTIDTGDGDNTIVTGSGDDTITTGSGDQTIYAVDGDNTIAAGDGNSSVTSGSGDDNIELGDGNQSIRAGDGNNSVTAGDGDHKVATGSGKDRIDLGDGDQMVVAGAGDDTIKAGHGDHTIISGTGDDNIDLGAGDHTVSADDGDDMVRAGDGDSRVSTGSGDDTVILGDGNHHVNAGTGNNMVTVGDGQGTIQAGDGDDRIQTGEGDWSIDAGGGDNTIDTGDGDDSVTTGDGDDRISTGDGSDTINAGDGNNTIDAGDGDDTIVSGAGDDTIQAGRGDDRITAGAGADVIDGGEGTDTVSYKDSTEGVAVDLGSGAGFGGDAEGDVLKNIENVEGSDQDDLIIGNGQDNVINGGAGDDLLSGGGGADHIIGGSGDDTVSYEYDDTGSDISLGGSSDQGFERSEGDILEETENVVGGDGDDRIQGNLSDNIMQGGAGDDAIYGLDGDDVLAGGEGNDRLYGGEGDDILAGGAGDDVLFGEAGDDVFIAGEGNDTIIGGEGQDTFYSEKGVESYTFERVGDGIQATDVETGDTTTIMGVEGFQFGDQAFHVNQIFDLTAPVGLDSIATGGPEDDGLDPGNAFEHPRKKAEDKGSAGIQAVQLSMAAAFGVALTTIPTAVAAENADGTMASDADSIFSIFTRPLDDRSTAVFKVNTVPVDQVQATPESLNTGSGDQRIVPDLVPASDVQMSDDESIATGIALQASTETDGTIADRDDSEPSVLPEEGEASGEADAESAVIMQTETTTVEEVADTEDEASEELLTASSTVVSSESVSDEAATEDTGAQNLAADVPELVLTDSAITADGCSQIEGGDGNDVLTGDIEDLRIELNFTGALSAQNINDGDTTLTVLVKLPDGVSLSRGTYRETTGDWLLEADEISGVELVAPVGIDDFNIQIQPVAEKNGSFTYGELQTLSFDVEGVGNDTIDGGKGNDIIDGGLGDDILAGGEGSDTVMGGDGIDVIDGGSGNDRIDGDEGNDILLGGAGTDTLAGGAGNDSLLGGEGADFLSGGSGDDILSFDEADLKVDGGSGFDIAALDETGGGQTIDTRLISDIEHVRLGSEDDTVLMDSSNDYILDGGDGFDILDGTGASALDIRLTDTVDGSEAIVNVEKVIGSGFDDTVSGNSQDDWISLGAGDDIVSGAAGDDLLNGDSGSDTLSGDAGDDNLSGGTGADSLFGGEGNDRLGFDADDIIIDGGAGTDTAVLETDNGQPIDGDRFRDVEHIELGDGSDTFNINSVNNYTLDGGDGDDTLDAGNAQSGVELTLSDTQSGDNWITGFDRIEGSAHDDTFTGDSSTDTLLGAAGNDFISGMAGDDILYGGLGNDTLSGGEGDDTLHFDGDDTLVSGGVGEDTAVLEGAQGQTVHSDVLDGIEHVELGSGDDQYMIKADNDYTLDGGGGSDTLDGSLAAAGLTLALSDTADGANFIYGFDTVIGSNHTDTLTGSSLADTIDGGAGADLVHGGQGNDDISGGTGNDILYGDGGVDTLAGGAGDDELHFDSIDASVDGGEGYDQAVLTNSSDGTVVDSAAFSGIEHFELGVNDERFELYGTNTDYSVAAGEGYDIIDAGAATEGVNLVLSDTAAGSTYLTGVEEIIGSDYVDTLTGDSAGNTLKGGAGDDTIDGGAGADDLQGGTGNDTFTFDISDTSINGGTGTDTAYLGSTADGAVIQGYTFSNMEHVVLGSADETFRLYTDNNYGITGGDGYDRIDASGAGSGLNIALSNSTEGSDYITGVEEISGSNYNDTLTGNASANTLYGNAGNDTINGGAGADVLNGGAGNDTLYFDTSDTVIGGSGYDTAIAVTGGAINVSNTFFNGIESVILTNNNDTITFNNSSTFAVNGGGGSDTINGSSSNAGLNLTTVSRVETVYGSNYNDTLGGDATNTTYFGGRGNDTIIGGGGTDTAVYSASLSDVINEMKTGGDAFISVNSGVVTIRTDLDGQDTLQQVEKLQFADTTFNLSANTPPYAVGEVLTSSDWTFPPHYVVDLDYDFSSPNNNPQDTFVRFDKSKLLANDFDIDAIDSIADIQIVSCSGGTVTDLGDTLQVKRSTYQIVDGTLSPELSDIQITYRVVDSRGVAGETAVATLQGLTPKIESLPTEGPPLIFDLDGDGAEIDETVNSGVLFDIDSDGIKEAMTTWAGADDGFLAYDVDGDGMVTRGEEIVLAGYHPDAKTDLEGLALAFDSDENGVFDSADKAWGSFGIWQDADQDGICDAGEFKTLEEAEIASVNLTSDNDAYDVGSAHVFGTGTYTKTDGTEADFADTTLGYTDNSVAGQDEEITDPELSEYEAFLAQYRSEMVEIASDLEGIQTTDEIQNPASTQDEQILIADELAAIHRDYNEQVLMPQQTQLEIDEGQGQIDQFVETSIFSELWLEEPEPDFLY